MPNQYSTPYIFICTKPLQIIVAMILSEKFFPAHLYVVGAFNNSLEVYKSTALYRHFSLSRHFRSRTEALRSASVKKPKAVFIDSDVGLKTQLALTSLKIHSPKSFIYVYEEGIGAYREDIIKSKLKKIIYKATGTACHFGGSILTKKIFLFSPHVYFARSPRTQEKAIQITKPLADFTLQNQDYILNIFAPSFQLPVKKERNAYLYLSDWKMSPPINIPESHDFYIKPHPHVSETDIDHAIRKTINANWIPAAIPAEIIINILSAIYDKVIIKHSNSSAVHYMQHLPNIIDSKDLATH